MTSTSTYRPVSPAEHDNLSQQNTSYHHASTFDSHRLSPSHIPSNSASPSVNNSLTPADSFTTHSQYQSEFSDDHEDPFFGVDFNSGPIDDPSFFENFGTAGGQVPFPEFTAEPLQHNATDSESYPLTPGQTASVHTASPRSERRGIARSATVPLPLSVSPQDLQKVGNAHPTYPYPSGPQLTPAQSGRSSEDDVVAPAVKMPCQSPRVTISMWDKNNNPPITTVERSFGPDGDGPSTTGGINSAGDLITSYAAQDSQHGRPQTPQQQQQQQQHPSHNSRDESGRWQRNPVTGLGGIAPEGRTTDEIVSVNEMVTRREIEERNQEVGKWLSANVEVASPEQLPSVPAKTATVENGDDGIPLGHETENRQLPDQPYYLQQPGGELTEEDLKIINSTRNWGNTPLIQSISRQGTDRFQPDSSQAAIEKFERLCKDNESIVSRAATWGTRRRSMPIIDIDIEALSGNFLKKLSLGQNRERKASLLKDLRCLVKKPSHNQLLKRSRSSHDEDGFKNEAETQQRDNVPRLAPPTRTSSWGKKPTPSINTAIVSMTTGVASVGGGSHVRKGSVSASSMTSPKSPFATLAVKNPIRRQRSKSDVPPAKNGNSTSHPNLVGMLKKQGGLPLAQLPNTSYVQDDDDEDDDDLLDDGDMKVESNNLIEDITPTQQGFSQHVLRLNPSLGTANTYLVDRIGHQQVQRYKTLLNSKVKHLQQGASCQCGSLCLALGGQARVLNEKGEPRAQDALSGRLDGSDGDMTPVEGAIAQENFPQDIPMPPTTTLPAEFECQLCFQPKKFQKPSDWTKHVHEDVQPFTCTWEKCRDAKIFKRKADWVRHENEGHRHLEWWMCDVEDCRHTCYRRDNFLQHLVREHKFAEPKVKTKAALKRSGGGDPTWAKVEACHVETSNRPQDEPCRFCGKTFPSWKKLTVHLAKHMEQISLPVLKLVDAKELDAETIISPISDPPMRSMPLPARDASTLRQYGPGAPVSVYPANAMDFGGFGGMQQQQQPQQQHVQLQQYPQTEQFVPGAFDSMHGFGMNLDTTSGMDLHPGSAHPISTPLSGTTLMTPLSAASGTSMVNNPNFGQQQHQQQHQQQQQQQRRHVQNVPVSAAQIGMPSSQFTSLTSSMEPFPQLDPMAMQNQGLGMSMGYGLMDQTHGNQDSFTPQGSVSPYSRSPNQRSGYYSHQL